MFQLRKLQAALGALALLGTASLHAQMAQDPLLSRTAAVEPSIVFVLDDSGSMASTMMFQYGGGTGFQGQRGPGDDAECNTGSTCIWVQPPGSIPGGDGTTATSKNRLYGRSPDVNLIYYDPRVTYKRRINPDGTFMAAGSVTGINNFGVFFYRPPTVTTFGVTSVPVINKGSGYPASGVTVSFPPIAAPGVRAQGTVQIASTNRVQTVNITSGGTYPNTGTISVAFAGGGGTGAAGTVNTTSTANALASVTLNNGNTFNVPAGTACTAAVIGGGGSGAAVGVTLAGGGSPRPVASFTITNPGTGYTANPTVRVTCPAVPTRDYATTRATMRVVSSVNMSSGGSGYTSAPVVTFTYSGTMVGPAASGIATLTATNVVNAIVITTPGSGYASCPVATLGGTGSGVGAALGTTVCSSTVVPGVNKGWDGVTDATLATNYFTPSYLPDSGSPLATGATASIVYPNTATATVTQYPKFRDRTDCAAATHCTWAEEQQNYANWRTYHSTRMNLAKTGIGLAFQPLNPTFRLGWGTINQLNTSSVLANNGGVRKFTSAIVSDFLTWLYAQTPTGGTPNRVATNRVGQYYQRTDDAGPWGNNPTGSNSLTNTGAANNQHATCRRAYTMLMTDGYYNNETFSIGDFDTTNGPVITSPSTYQYTPIGPYSDNTSGTPVGSTFADVGMRYWLTDLRPDLPNNVRPVPSDDAFWQHVNFYAIGLGVLGTLDSTSPTVLQELTGNSSSSPPRSRSWPTPANNSPTSIDDMWHATINGRGKLLNAKTSDDLNQAITRMMSDISGREGTQSGVAVSTTNLIRGTKKYTPSYTPVTWNGNVTAFTLNEVSGVQTGIAWQIETLTATDPVTGARTYSTLMPGAAVRNIAVGTGATSGTRAFPFTFSGMGGLVSQMAPGTNANLIDYLRGDATNEDNNVASPSPTAIYRPRLTRLGDIVNSTPVFVKDSVDLQYDIATSTVSGKAGYRVFVGQKKARTEGVIFVGANDGMLHAFRDGTYDSSGAALTQGGLEVFAYVPNAVLPSLHKLADKTYVHQYYVDGPQTETDAYLGGAWKNVVLGSTGAGAGVGSTPGVSPRTGIYAIDVTSLNSGPTGLTTTSVLWEVNPTIAAFAEMGYVLTDIQSGYTASGKWVAIFGNGYESKSCKASLFVVNMEDGSLVREIPTGIGACGAGTRNGLGGVRVVVDDKTKVIKGVYAGDLMGNMWKFNLSSASEGAWALDLAGSALFAAGATKPITAPPTVLPLPMIGTTDPKPGYMVVFGTGKFYEVSDIATTAQQTMYGVWDQALFGAGGTGLVPVSSLVQQTVSAPQLGPNGNTYFSISNNAITYTGASAKRGWFINFPNTGQRMVYPLDLLAERFVVSDTISPSNVSLDPCANENGGVGFLYIVDALNGGGPTEAILDTNGDGNVDSNDLVVSGIEGKADGRNVSLLVSKTDLETKYANVSGGDPGSTLLSISCRLTNTCKTSAPGVRRQWRQLFLR